MSAPRDQICTLTREGRGKRRPGFIRMVFYCFTFKPYSFPRGRVHERGESTPVVRCRSGADRDQLRDLDRRLRAAVSATVPPAFGHHGEQHERNVGRSGVGTRGRSAGDVRSGVREVDSFVPRPWTKSCVGERITDPSVHGRAPCGSGTLRLFFRGRGKETLSEFIGHLLRACDRGLHGEHRSQFLPRQVARLARNRRCRGLDREVGTGAHGDVVSGQHHAARNGTRHGFSTRAGDAFRRLALPCARGIRG